MRIQYEYTIDELIDVQVRTAARSKVARKWRRQAVTVAALLNGLIWGAVALIFAYFITQSAWALVVALCAALVGAARAVSLYHGKFREQYRKYFREKFGERETLPFELELNEAGIWTRQFGVQSTFEWSHVEDTTISDSVIEFYMYGGGSVSVRKSAFASQAEQQAFIDAARQHLHVSRTSSNWLRDG